MAEFTEGKLIAMRKNLGFGHKGDILITTHQRVNANQEPITKDIIDESHAFEIIRRWNSQPDLLKACKTADIALNKCIRYFLGTGPQPEPEELVDAPIQIKAAIAAAEEGE